MAEIAEIIPFRLTPLSRLTGNAQICGTLQIIVTEEQM